MIKPSHSLFPFSGLPVPVCTAQTGWTAAVDSYNDRNAYRLNQDIQECRQLAEPAVGGAALADAGIGAAMGTSAGGIGGASKRFTNRTAIQTRLQQLLEATRTCRH
ncbi:MAG: hypothetical protein M0R33_02450 [Methylomonas sp.]|jgi:hypothetical protein|uniref:hypothetical protein n=1 Tax=Methylomonas sp. TaxID=418 RepID=UPI0025F03F3B|nr:hypothetical protein [Methylomonas sp.]MCK9605291.1 hypothetical protein [Methylomonas sp.]